LRHKPELTVLTGDYLINSLEHTRELRALVRRLPRPCIATLGNHDHIAGAGAVQEVFQRAGIPVLRNTSYRLTVRGTPLAVVGIDDACTHHHDVERAMADLLPGERAIVLTHVPDLADEVSGYGDHLVLAGHTHGGQIYFPLVTPFLADLAGHRYLAGWYEVGGTQMYVNVGIGCARFRRRIGAGAQPELAIIKLLPTKDSSRDA
jgi:predicted MPP superfamily phosphohydrolase